MNSRHNFDPAFTASGNFVTQAQYDALVAALRAVTGVPARYDVMPKAALEMYELARAALASVQS